MVNDLKPLLYTRVYFPSSGKMYWESCNYISLAVIQLYERNFNQAAINICNLTVERFFRSRSDVCKKKNVSADLRLRVDYAEETDIFRCQSFIGALPHKNESTLKFQGHFARVKLFELQNYK